MKSIKVDQGIDQSLQERNIISLDNEIRSTHDDSADDLIRTTLTIAKMTPP